MHENMLYKKNNTDTNIIALLYIFKLLISIIENIIYTIPNKLVIDNPSIIYIYKNGRDITYVPKRNVCIGNFEPLKYNLTPPCLKANLGIIQLNSSKYYKYRNPYPLLFQSINLYHRQVPTYLSTQPKY